MKKNFVFIISIIVLAVLCITLLTTTLTYKHKVDEYQSKIDKQEKLIKKQKDEIKLLEKIKDAADEMVKAFYHDKANEETDGKYEEWRNNILKSAKDNGGDGDETLAEMEDRLDKENVEVQQQIDKTLYGE